MGRPEQRQREKRKAAKTCTKLDKFFVVPDTKKSKSDDASQPCGSNLTGQDEIPSEHRQQRDQDEGAKTFCPPEKTSEQADLMKPSTSEGLACDKSCGIDDSKVLETSATDIGNYITATMTPSEIQETIDRLSQKKKYDLLKNHNKPKDTYPFPTTYAGGCNRKFRLCWLEEHPWMVYSEALDGVFCIACVLFCKNRKNKGQFVNMPFIAWQKKSEKCKEHEKAQYHLESLFSADIFTQDVEKPEASLPSRIDRRKQANIQRNRHLVKTLADVALFCGRQCIALRGDRENINTPGNPGNFLALLKTLSNYDTILKNHLESPAMKNVTYMSPKTQNELLDIMARDIILSDLVSEIKTAQFYSILADEVTSNNTEQLALCVRFVDSESNIREEFLHFTYVARITGVHLSKAILDILHELNLPVEGIRGQGYDGASNMSSDSVGVQRRIREKAPLATYIHCSGHSLNLVISHCCGIPSIRNMLDRLKKCCRFFLNSPKRNGLLELIVQKGASDTRKKKALLDLCRTRWAERHSAYTHFYRSFPFIVQALDMIGYGLDEEQKREYALYADWDPSSKADAQQILASISTFDFAVVFMTVYQYLSHLSGLTVKLQSTTLDILEAHKQILEVKEIYKTERENVHDESTGYSRIYNQALEMAEKVGATPCMPRVSKRQQHRSAVSTDTPLAHYRTNLAIPLLDYVISDFEDRFSKLSVTAASLLGIIPSIICEKEVDIQDAVETYSNDLPSPELVAQELLRWKLRFSRIPPEERPSSPAAAIKQCNPKDFPNLRILLQIACTLPVTSCECERSASVIRRLHTYMRASMTEDRLTSLALLHIHYDKTVNLDKVVNLFARDSHRMELDSLIKPNDSV